MHFRLAPANLAVSGDARTSAGLSEFYKRTMNNLPPVSWKTGYEQYVTCSVYFVLSGSNVNPGAGTVSNYVNYVFAYSEYFMTANNKNLAVYHGAGADGGAAPADGDWHIYEVDSGGNKTYLGSM
jgi:hypothetical protein